MQPQAETCAGHYVGILLAAGKGQRFDPSGAHNKLMQPLPSGELLARGDFIGASSVNGNVDVNSGGGPN